MAAGKSRIGRLLAERLNVPFVDTDAEIEQAQGMAVAEIFRVRGEAEFRDAERRLISELMADGPQVIAVGGGAFVDAATRQTLNRSARTIWLDPSFELIAERVARSTSRPLASSRSQAELRQLWQERRRCYAEAHIRIEPFDGDPGLVVEEIVERLEETG